MTAAELLETLRRANLEHYYPSFYSNGVTDLDALLELSVDDYAYLGITSSEDRRNLYSLIKSLQDPASPVYEQPPQPRKNRSRASTFHEDAASGSMGFAHSLRPSSYEGESMTSQSYLSSPEDMRGVVNARRGSIMCDAPGDLADPHRYYGSQQQRSRPLARNGIAAPSRLTPPSSSAEPKRQPAPAQLQTQSPPSYSGNAASSGLRRRPGVSNFGEEATGEQSGNPPATGAPTARRLQRSSTLMARRISTIPTSASMGLASRISPPTNSGTGAQRRIPTASHASRATELLQRSSKLDSFGDDDGDEGLERVVRQGTTSSGLVNAYGVGTVRGGPGTLARRQGPRGRLTLAASSA
ncbi:hypothetical protein EV182_002250, partial [Spiromyces aspiralis]